MSKNAEGKSQRSFVVEDAVWHASLASTKAAGTTVSAVIRDALIAFNEANPVSAVVVKKTAAESRAKGVASEAAKTPAKKAAKAPTDRELSKSIETALATKAAKTAARAKSTDATVVNLRASGTTARKIAASTVAGRNRRASK